MAKDEKRTPDEDAMTIALAAAAAAYSDLLVRIAQLTQALIAKGVITAADVEKSMTAEERSDLYDVATDRFGNQLFELGKTKARIDRARPSTP